MSSQQKQLLILLVSAIVLVALGVLAYFFFFKSPAPTGDLVHKNTTGGGGFGQSNVPQKNSSGGGDTPAPASQPTLFQIHDQPIVGFVVFVREGNSYARFIEQGTGHVYEYNFDTKQKVRISNTSIPQIVSASWSSDGNTVAFQYLENTSLRSAIGELATTSEEGSYKKISFLPLGAAAVSVSPDGAFVAYATVGTNGGVVTIAKKDGTGAKIVFTSPLTRWLLSWRTQKALLIESPLSKSGGVVYAVDVTTGARTTSYITEGSFPGVTAATDGVTYLYTPVWSTGVTRLNSKTDSEFTLFSMNTIPDKCSFVATSTDYALCGASQNKSAPILSDFEAWLRGETAAADTIYLVNFNRGVWLPPIRSEDLGDRTFDVEHIEGDGRITYAAFKERMGQTLWGIWLRPALSI